jgi:hypothetical protein
MTRSLSVGEAFETFEMIGAVVAALDTVGATRPTPMAATSGIRSFRIVPSFGPIRDRERMAWRVSPCTRGG